MSLVKNEFGISMMQKRNLLLTTSAMLVVGTFSANAQSVLAIEDACFGINPVQIDGCEYENSGVTYGTLDDIAGADFEGGFQISTVDLEYDQPVLGGLSEDWFYIGLADITAGNFGERFVDGRLAFYLSGPVGDGVTLTAAADTGEGPLEDIFRNLDDKSPHSLISRLDPDDYYQTYGDDSTFIDDAPTNGKFYVRLERGDDHLVWGLFDTSIAGSHYLRSERTLYGAEGVYRSDELTASGDVRGEATVYAAQPETSPQRDVLLGTGGSAYFLKRQYIISGSETISVVIKDANSDRVLDTAVLQYGDDYTIDYNQGVIILTRPLNSTVGTGGVVTNGALGDARVNLIAQYEYTPTLVDLDGFSFGGRGQYWINDQVRVGVTALSDVSGLVNHQAAGADLLVKYGENSYLEAEYAQSRGPGFGSSYSSDGGLTYTDIATAGSDAIGETYRVKVHAELSDVVDPSINGNIGAYFEQMRAGVSLLDNEITDAQNTWGVYGAYQVSEQLAFGITYDDYSNGAGNFNKEGEVNLSYAISSNLVLDFGLQMLDKGTVGDPLLSGGRTELGVRLTHNIDDENSAYIFGQKTVSIYGGLTKNDRYGIGGDFQLSEVVRINGELSNGTSGFAAQSMLEYQPNEDSLYYFGYRLDPDQAPDSIVLTGADNGSFVIGARRTYNDHLSGYVENSYSLFGAHQSTTNAYGITYTPNDMWVYSGSMETGRIRDDINGDFDRTAVSFGVDYNDSERMSARLRVEGRWEDGDGVAQDRTTYLLTSGAQVQTSEDWRIVASLDGVVSTSDQSSLLDGRYIEASMGYAYRPVLNDRLNVLFKYTYLYDMPGPDQVSAGGTTNGPKQESHILSVDAIYDINERFSVGGKYGYRLASVADRSSDIFEPNTAHLATAKVDFHIVHEWDGQIEARALYTEESDMLETGATAAIYRHLGNNFKAGVGYHFGNVNSDLLSFDNTNGGLFFNLITKF